MITRQRGQGWLGGCLCLGLIVVIDGRAVADTPASDRFGGVQPREVVLDNGLTLLLVERHEQPTVACGVFYNVGGVNDPLGKSGIAHLFEHMLFKGSRVIGITDSEAEEKLIAEQDRVRAQLEAEMDRMREMKRRGEITDVLDPRQWTPQYTALKKRDDELAHAQRKLVKNNELANLYTTNGGTFNASTMTDTTFYYVELPSNKLELFFWIEADRMANGVMREFYVERDNVREERRLRVESTPTGRQDEAFNALFWQSHPYGIPVIGWPAEVESISREDALEFYKTYYAPNNARVVVVGDFEPKQAIALAQRYFGRIPRGTNPPPPVNAEESAPLAERRFLAEAETNPRVRIRFHTTAIGHKDEAALDVLAELLSGKTGRLYKRLVTKEEAALGEPMAGNRAQKFAGYFEIGVTVKEGHKPEEVEAMVLEEIDRLRTGEIGERELQKVKNQVLASTVQRLRTNRGLMFQVGLFDSWLDWSYINDSPRRMLAVTPEDVRRVVDRYFDPKTRTVAVYTTKEKKAEPTKAPTGDKEAAAQATPAGGGPSPAPAGGSTAAATTWSHPAMSDPEVPPMMESLPEKLRPALRARLEQIYQIDDPKRLEVWATLIGASLDERPRPEDETRMFEFLQRKMMERAAILKDQPAAKDTQGKKGD